MATNTPRLQLFQGDGTNFMLVDPLFYEIKRTGKTITVPAGFVTDFASVPWYARSLISVLGRHSIPAIVHDYLYWEQRCTRDQADDILREAMNEYSSSWRDQIAVDYAVKYGAQGAWDQNKADRKKGYIRVLTGGNQNIPLNMDWERTVSSFSSSTPPNRPSGPARRTTACCRRSDRRTLLPQPEVFPFFLGNFCAELKFERRRLHLIVRHRAFIFQPVPAMIGADRCAVSGDDIILKSGTTLAACFNAIDAFQVLALANGIEAPNIAGLMGAFLRFELQQYAIHRASANAFDPLTAQLRAMSSRIKPFV